jgi:outer membrane lipopolysaccharide assembly protein LptE/RlpB
MRAAIKGTDTTTMIRVYKLLALTILAALLLASCGYTLSRKGSQAGPSAGKRNVVIPTFANDTFEPLLERELTQALKDEIAMDGRWVLTDAGDADLSVTGRVTYFELQPLSYDAKERIQEYRIEIRSEVKVTDLKTGDVIWKDPAIETFSEYRVTSDITKSKIGRGEAIKKASKDFAEEFVIKALDTF